MWIGNPAVSLIGLLLLISSPAACSDPFTFTLEAYPGEIKRRTGPSTYGKA